MSSWNCNFLAVFSAVCYTIYKCVFYSRHLLSWVLNRVRESYVPWKAALWPWPLYLWLQGHSRELLKSLYRRDRAGMCRFYLMCSGDWKLLKCYRKSFLWLLKLNTISCCLLGHKRSYFLPFRPNCIFYQFEIHHVNIVFCIILQNSLTSMILRNMHTKQILYIISN